MENEMNRVFQETKRTCENSKKSFIKLEKKRWEAMNFKN